MGQSPEIAGSAGTQVRATPASPDHANPEKCRPMRPGERRSRGRQHSAKLVCAWEFSRSNIFLKNNRFMIAFFRGLFQQQVAQRSDRRAIPARSEPAVFGKTSEYRPASICKGAIHGRTNRAWLYSGRADQGL